MENGHIQHIIQLLQETYNGHPWHGRSLKSLLSEVTPEMALKKPDANSHSIAELVYHLITWREFTISRLQPEEGKDTHYFESIDWRPLDLSSNKTWEEGLRLLEESQQRILAVLEEFNDSILPEVVAERKYKFKVLLYGLVQHEAYHAGQIAYAMKLSQLH
jgi:uncharacterized damage-inducible protein DinB